MIITKTSDEVVDYVLNVLELNNQLKVNGTCSMNAFQTPNILDKFNSGVLNIILNPHFIAEEVFHLHIIEYYENGYQAAHDHAKTEKFSFILYLNDSDGNTVFHGHEPCEIVPEKGKLVLFPGDILHEALVSNKNKKVLVGAINRL